MSALETEKTQVAADLKEAIQESDLKCNENKELTTVIQNSETRLAELESVLENLKYIRFSFVI